MTWTALILYYFQILSRKWGVFGAPLLAMLKDGVVGICGDEVLPLFESPDALKAAIDKYLREKLAPAIGNKLASDILIHAADSISNDIVDLVWNYLHANKHVDKTVSDFRAPANVTIGGAELMANPLYASAMEQLKAA